MDKTNQPILLSFKKENVPHLVLEVNQKCNIRCRACYKNNSNYTKPFDLIKQEIDFALTKRRLRGITLAGGEPTLHPQLGEVIRYISRKGIAVRILTNGYNFTIEQLRAYKDAGLSDVFLHIDSLQTRPDAPRVEHERELNPLREEICKKVMAAGLNCKLEVTLYQKNLKQLDEVVAYVLKSEFFHRMLVTNFTDFQKIGSLYNNGTKDFSDKDFDPQTVSNAEVEAKLSGSLGMVPYAYIGSSHDLKGKRWLYYGALTIHEKDGNPNIIHFLPQHKFLIKLLNKLSKQKERRVNLREQSFFGRFIMTDIVCALFLTDVKLLFNFIRQAKSLFVPGTKWSVKNFIFQQGPNLRPDGEIEYCHNCPDATVRDGKLTVLCLADQIDPEKLIEL